MTIEETPGGGDVSAGAERVGVESADDVRARRERLRAELVALEQVLTAPIADADAWLAQVRTAAESMLETLRSHVEATEAAEGMLAQIARDAPHLEGRAEGLRDEHAALLDAARALVGTCDVAPPAEVRDEALALLQSISRHRQRGTDLLYDAYLVDISAAD